jgi:MIP family channel proteins
LGLLGVSLAFGLIIAAMVSATMHVSGGQLNPAVTLGLLVTRKIPLLEAGVLIAAQLIGAVLAGFALTLFFTHEVQAAAQLGATTLADDLPAAQGVVVEVITTFLLVFTIFGTAVDPRGPRVGGLFIGLVVAANIILSGPRTGGSMNPARSFGPALAGGVWDSHWVYWVGPIVGGILAAVVYDAAFLRPPKQPRAEYEA